MEQGPFLTPCIHSRARVAVPLFAVPKLIADVFVSDHDAQGEYDDVDVEAMEGASQEYYCQKTLQSQRDSVLHDRMLRNAKHGAVPQLSGNCVFFLDCVVKLVMQEEAVAFPELDRRVPG